MTSVSTVVHDEFASPLSLIRQWADLPGNPPLRELVILGYTLDLAFLERVCLPQARQLGARVTVVADAGQGVHDAVDVRLAGRVYQHGVTATRGAFHPKLAVLLGDDRVWAAVGSGNPTMAGWGHNHELWCVLRGAVDHGPRVQADLGRWLGRLPDEVLLSSWIAGTLREIGARLVPATVDDTHSDVALLHNFDRPILDQLDADDADELHLVAPFVDPGGGAVRQLIARSSPRRMRVALQPGRSSFDGRALLDAARAVDDVAFTGVDDARTLHAKLIEWTSAGETTAVVGSPNLTTAALGGAVRDGHNCELAVRAPVRMSLFPVGEPLTRAEVAATGWNRPDIDVRTRPLVRLLGCRRDDTGLVVELVCRDAVEVTLETSVDGSPGSWAPKAVVPAAAVVPGGRTVVAFVAPEVVGGAVRAVVMVRGERVASAAVFVTDVVRCRPRPDPGHGPRMSDRGPVDEVFADPLLARRFHDDVQRLLDHTARPAVAPLRRSWGAETATRSAADRWQAFLDRVEQSLGPTLTALVYPGARPPDSPPPTDAGWVLGDVVDETELAEGETDAVLDDEELLGERAWSTPEQHRRQRSWMQKWVGAVRRPRDSAAARPAVELRMLVASLFVNRLAAATWQGGGGWRAELAALVEALVPDPAHAGDETEQQQGYLESWVAVCLALLLQDASLHGGGAADVTAQRAWRAGHRLAAAADPSLIRGMLAESTLPYARVTSAGEVRDVMALAQEQLADPLARIVAGFAADGLDVHQQHGAWIVSGSFRRATPLAARVLTELCPSGVGVVIATNGTAGAILVLRGERLLVAESGRRTWRAFRIQPPLTPASLFRPGDSAPRADGTPLPAEVIEAGAAAGVDVGALVRQYLSQV